VDYELVEKRLTRGSSEHFGSSLLYTRRTRAAIRDIQLRFVGRASAGGSSAAGYPQPRDQILRSMSKEFDALLREDGSSVGSSRASPARRAAANFYSVRSERMLMEQMKYNLLFRWFVGLEIDEPV
jgi:hypothetical protein